MSGYAVVRRRFQFEAGPEKTTFHACDEHQDRLGVGTTDVMCFFAVTSEPPEPVSVDDEIDCDFCRER